MKGEDEEEEDLVVEGGQRVECGIYCCLGKARGLDTRNKV